MIVKDSDVGKRFEIQYRNGTLLVGTLRTLREEAKDPNFLVEDVTGQLHMVIAAAVQKVRPL